MELIIYLKVTTRAAENKIGDISKDLFGNYVLRIYVTAVPEQGKANQAVINLLAKEWKLAKSSLEIIKGSTSTSKQLLIRHASDLIQKLFS